LLAAGIAMLVQTQELMPLLWVALVFGVGQILESGVLTPKLVGDRIGLHPVAVIFSILAGGQLFGFVGVLVALPVAAVIAVLLRHARRQWLRSPLYAVDMGPPAKESPPP
jgi:predicted PurR-regulated permease PerM